MISLQRVNVAVRLDDRPQRLGVGFRVYVRIYYDQADGALILPRTALFRSARGTWQVMVVRNGMTAIQQIEVGLMNERDAAVRSGLTPDDLVLARPSREISAGMRVDTTRGSE